MRRLPSGKILAFALILILLTIRFGSLSEETFVHPVQDSLFKTAHISEEKAKSKPSTLKTKRTLGDAFCGSVDLLAAFVPVESRLTPSFPFQALPEVYLDIFIPPDEPA